EVDPAELDVFALAERAAASGAAPRLGFDCGVDDQLVVDNRRFHAHLDRIGLRHQYAEHPGGHTWSYWDDHVREALAQHAELFGVGRAAPAPRRPRPGRAATACAQRAKPAAERRHARGP